MKTKPNRVQERAFFYPFSHTVTLRVTLNVSPKPLISKKIPFTKIQILPPKIFLIDWVLKLLNLFVFKSIS